MRTTMLGVAIGLALADSSIVTLALPDVLRDFDVGITTVAWVLTSFNLVLAALAVPAAYVARRRPRKAYAAGALVFAAASLACGFAPSFEVLVGARCVQAAGAALIVTAALDLLSETLHSSERAFRVWITAGIVGAALGPAIGGVLTQVLGWQSIFLLQVPVAIVVLSALRGLEAQPVPAPAGRPHLTANLALLLVAGGLVAALFLIVLLLVDGWGISPAAAGLVVTVMPAAAIVVSRYRPRMGVVTEIASGVILVSGGLAALAFMPRAGWAWTIPPQLLVGAGLGLAIAGLTAIALRGRADQVVHGGWTIAARHAGVVLGLLLLAPVLTTALDKSRDEAIRAGAAVVLDSGVPPLDKLGLAQDVLDEVERAKGVGELPRVGAVFGDRPDDDEWRSLASELQDQLDRAVTSAFSRPFLLAAVLALAALVPVGFMRWRTA
jgi:MFS family permease